MRQLFRLGDQEHGSGRVLFSWQPEGNFLASAGANGVLHVFDRHGEKVAETSLPTRSPCTGLDWDADGETIALLQDGSNSVHLWDLATRRLNILETNLRNPTFMRWAKHSPTLAVGDSRGNLLLYSKETRRKIPVVGKHGGSICSGSWSSEGVLALGGEDHNLTLSNAQGDTLEQTELKATPRFMQFATQKIDSAFRRGPGVDAGRASENTVSVNLEGRSILLYNLEHPEKPMELAFQEKYGSVVTYEWFGDGYMMIGFQRGWIVMISTHEEEVGEELFSGQFHEEQLDDLAFSPPLQRAAAAGGSVVRIIDVQTRQEIREDEIRLDPRMGLVDRVQWTKDGQILTLSTRSGHLLSFLASMPIMHQSQGARIAFLTSLREVTVVDTMADDARVKVPVRIEPGFLGLGPHHVAVGMNARVWYHRLLGDRGPFEREYVSSVDQVVVGETFAAVRAGGKAYLHPIEPSASARDDIRIFPQREGSPPITALAMAPDFLLIGTETGSVDVFHLSSGTMLEGSQFRHELSEAAVGAGADATTNAAISSIHPNHAGTRMVIVDRAMRAYFFNPVDGLRLRVPSTPERIQRILWDPADWGLFVLSDGHQLISYLHTAHTVNGPQLNQLGEVQLTEDGAILTEPHASSLPRGMHPMVVYNGTVVCQGQGGRLQRVPCHTHKHLTKASRQSKDRLLAAFGQSLQLLRFGDARDIAQLLDERSVFLALANRAMEVLRPDVAVRVYRHLGDAGMVVSLESISEIEDTNLLAGHMAMLFADYDRAQELFLESTDPRSALQLRMDLLQWDQALRLAESLAPDEVPRISIELAKQQELRGDYATALATYRRAQGRLPPFPVGFSAQEETEPKDVDDVEGPEWLEGAPLAALHRWCNAGLARSFLHTGEVRRGLTLARDGPASLAKECAAILEELRQFRDAAELYQRAGAWEKAAGLLIRSKAFDAVAPLMDRVTSPTLLVAYAKAQEQAGNFHGAIDAYERARDHDNVVRILVDQLQDPERAGAIVRKTRSVQAARKLSAYCQQVRNTRGAIEFLLIARQTEEAFNLACEHGSEVPKEEYVRVAQYFESKRDWGEAGKYFALAGQHHRALRHYLQCGEERLEDAIDVVGKAKNDLLTHTLIDFLMGETDGVPKDPNYVFKLYMALGNFTQAARTAVIIARQEQELGNYRMAHGILYETHRDLAEREIRIPMELDRHLELLHSYMLVKRLVKRNDHLGAAKMLIRVSAQISKFPAHTVPILTSTVIECQRAGLKQSAYEYATMLMRPEYRNQIEEKLRRKIEGLVRRPNREEREEELAPCPVCRYSLPAWTLACPSCKTHLPYCIATGRHMVLEDWSECPRCRWPALYAGLSHLVQAEGEEASCPMCEQTIVRGTVRRSRDPAADLQRWLGLTQEREEEEQAGEEGEEGEEEEVEDASPSAMAGAGEGGGGGGTRNQTKRGGGAAAAAAAAMGF